MSRTLAATVVIWIVSTSLAFAGEPAQRVTSIEERLLEAELSAIVQTYEKAQVLKLEAGLQSALASRDPEGDKLRQDRITALDGIIGHLLQKAEHAQARLVNHRALRATEASESTGPKYTPASKEPEATLDLQFPSKPESALDLRVAADSTWQTVQGESIVIRYRLGEKKVFGLVKATGQWEEQLLPAGLEAGPQVDGEVAFVRVGAKVFAFGNAGSGWAELDLQVKTVPSVEFGNKGDVVASLGDHQWLYSRASGKWSILPPAIAK